MCQSTVDWCEANYTVTKYVAEFWNSSSGLAIVVSAIYWRYSSVTSDVFSGAFGHCFKDIFWYLLLVGVGTMLFHGTLLYKYQLLDELPMLMIAIEYVKLTCTLSTSIELFSFKFLLRATTLVRVGNYLVCIIPFTYLWGPYAQILSFHATLKVFEGTLLYILWNLSRSLNAIVYKCVYRKYDTMDSDTVNRVSLSTCGESPFIERSRNSKRLKLVQQDLREYIEYKKALRMYTKRGLCLYAFSISLWVIENLFCDWVRPLQLHAWWHILSSMGIYNLNKLLEQHVRISVLCYRKDKTE
ncbi:MAG: hypothetical protein EBU90_04105 [Proteobacteria bacterium]|nr:hypothetical protein [Pseudomonadota bacterium]NBP13924.1 hypothetical protein [bacterium]